MAATLRTGSFRSSDRRLHTGQLEEDVLQALGALLHADDADALPRKAQAHLASGTFQAQHGYYPQVVWLLTNQARAGRLAEQIAADQTLTPGLFKITAAPEQLAALIQRGP